MKLHYFEHVPYEGLGHIEIWANDNGHTITSTKFHFGERLPHIDDFDWLIIMGGPMSVHDETEYPWLVDEKRFVADAISAHKTILGICLGAQLIANVLGAEVAPMSHREVGWYPIRKSGACKSIFMSSLLPDEIEVFHWHGDKSEIPEGAVRIASSDACQNQGFVYSDRVIALQFHPEMIPAVAQRIIEHSSVKLGEGKWVQSAESMLRDSARFENANRLMSRILDHLASVP